jgi:TPR repeat protein
MAPETGYLLLLIVIGVAGAIAVFALFEKVGELLRAAEEKTAAEKQAQWEKDHPDIPKLRKMAELHHHSAQIELGLAYYHGRSVPQDYSEAFKWISIAAGRGYSDVHGIAQSVLAAMYFAGHGTPKDPVLAHVYFNLAAAKGNGAAKESRDTITPLLSGPQLEHAHRLAREWKPTT